MVRARSTAQTVMMDPATAAGTGHPRRYLYMPRIYICGLLQQTIWLGISRRSQLPRVNVEFMQLAANDHDLYVARAHRMYGHHS